MYEVAVLLVEVSVDVVVSSELFRSATNVRPTVQLWNRNHLEVTVQDVYEHVDLGRKRSKSFLLSMAALARKSRRASSNL